MKRLGSELSKVIQNLDGDAAKFMQIAHNKACYEQAIKSVWKHADAARLILDSTNAFYVRNDDRPRKGPDKDKPYIVCEICADDPLVRSELDTHRELLSLKLKESGLTFEELRIIPARHGMRKRHPFKVDAS